MGNFPLSHLVNFGVNLDHDAADRVAERLEPSTVTSAPASRTASPFAPFRHRVFFWLWLGVVCSSIGYWGQTVGAQWLFVNDPHAATIVPLVQTAGTLPIMLLPCPPASWPTPSTGAGCCWRSRSMSSG